jgi:hypothetical protein
MTHASDGALQAYLDGELEREEETAVTRHLEGCGECAAELASLRAAGTLFSSAMAEADTAAPVAQAAAAVRSKAPPRVIPLARPAAARRRAAYGSALGALPRAAVLVLGLAAVASATIPGSPVREWVVATWERVWAEPAAEAPPPVVAEREAEPELPVSGVSIRSANGSIEIFVDGAAADSRIAVRLVDGDRATVEATGGAAAARFFTGPGRIQVRGGDQGEFRIDLPRGARSVRIEVDGRAYLVMESGALRFQMPSEESGDAELLFRIGR